MKSNRGRFKTPATAATILLREHYRKLGIEVGWGREQVNKLCGLLKVTPFELGELVAIPTRDMRAYLRRDKIPPTVALHFQIIQDWYGWKKLGVPFAPRIPIDLLVF